ncbi:uncharacterized protein LOC126576532 [Anopheles aquasalis]|uniref:uncharacterized protein LOC126576532 n=1 Tax=Anopheles aquasalis TaxID=42839 RepID=UPI00215A0FA4|nr:uncharacterized protein LOC126576532 [Anopheles aquasalis]
MEVQKTANSRKKEKRCTLVLEATEASQPFEKRTITFRPGTDVGVGRILRQAAFVPNRTLFFKNKIISKQHASFTYTDGKFFLKDLSSSNGTYLNDVLLGDAESDAGSNRAVEVKTGDIVRFGVSRVAFATNEVCQAIVGRLTLIPPQRITKETMTQHTLKSFTPFEGYREHEALLTKCCEKMTEEKVIPEIRKCHQDTEIESIVTSVSGTQTMAENDASTAMMKERITKESRAHVLSLWQALVLSMTIIVGYQMYLTFF